MESQASLIKLAPTEISVGAAWFARDGSEESVLAVETLCEAGGFPSITVINKIRSLLGT